MCGIVGYLGPRQAVPVLIKGLQRLEYRGYDSAGIAVVDTVGRLHVFKRKGRVADLKQMLANQKIDAHIGIGHTRWATHGEPNDVNAHPHVSQSGRLAIVHNGIIENYDVIKAFLTKKGYSFVSDTDTEVVVQLIEYFMESKGMDTYDAVLYALKEIVGAYAIVVLDRENPDMLIAARQSSPLVIGLGEGEYIVASDATPILEYTRKVIYMDDGEIAIIDINEGVELRNIDNKRVSAEVQELEWELEAIEKGGYPHFMLKEIYEQPRSLLDSMRGRVNVAENMVRLGGIMPYLDRILSAPRISLLGCGTSWHAALVGKYLFEDLARIPAYVDYASEFRYRNPVILPDDVFIAISQSGETADTLAAVQLAKEEGALVLGICNVVGSSLARMTDAGVYTHAGPEIGVASTKAFTAQLLVLTLMALLFGKEKGTIPEEKFAKILTELEELPDKVQMILDKADPIVQEIAQQFQNASNFLYLGRGYNYPVALEGALKLKEISYIHAEGYPAAEMKHGPIALIDENMPVLIIATNQSAYEKIVNNAMEVKSRNGRIISVVNEGDKQLKQLSEYVIEIPETEEVLSPILTVIPLQLLAYHIAVLRGCDVDKPRNLAKSVTVE
ncbi:MAG: glutamine--fructose-6-phosphate transaminase (isomerizing) [Chlorobi bacterium]|nr:glutamine--fructose-6-phosphate transaminase (isomerizing) [Chlorobiota bacterium]